MGSMFYGGKLNPTTNRCRNFTSTFNRVVPRAVFGSDGGILGVGASEVVVILLVGWFLLGPEKLFSLTKETGRVLGQLRKTAYEAKDTFSEALDYEVMTQEAKKALEEGFTEGSKDTSKDTSKDISKDTNEEDNEGEDTVATVENHIPSEDIDVQDSPEEVSEANQAFLEQLKRVADPHQVAPTEIPDLAPVDESESDYQLELKRLEQQYLDARKKLDEKRTKQVTSEDLGDDSKENVR